jgi:cytosine/adenosine deaminase-related metal-dependent hydrolase
MAMARTTQLVQEGFVKSRSEVGSGDLGQQPRLLKPLVSATFLAAEALNLGSEIGTIAPGMTADIVAMRGDYLAGATACARWHS